MFASLVLVGHAARTAWSSWPTPYLTKPWARKSSVWKWCRAAAARIAG